MQFTYTQKQHLYEHGFVQIPGVVPKVRVDEALRAINHSFGEGIDPEQLTRFRAQSYCPELRDTPAITNLFNGSPIVELIESVLGEGNVNPTRGGQIAVRFPRLTDPPGEARPHLDGMYSPTNGVKKGTIGNFTMLVGVTLSPLTQPFAGNLAVWPGSHRKYEPYFNEHGPEALLDGMPPVDIGQPIHVLAQPGDVTFCHYQLAHGTAPNVSPFPRYAIYFRVTTNARVDWKTPMVDIWSEWPGMRDVVAAAR